MVKFTIWLYIPLKYMDNIVLSRRKNTFDLSGKGYLLNDINLLPIFCKSREYEENWIIGGNEIYKQMLEMDLVDNIYITEIEDEKKCNTFFPELNNNFELNSEESINYEGKNITHKIFAKNKKK